MTRPFSDLRRKLRSLDWLERAERYWAKADDAMRRGDDAAERTYINLALAAEEVARRDAEGVS